MMSLSKDVVLFTKQVLDLVRLNFVEKLKFLLEGMDRSLALQLIRQQTDVIFKSNNYSILLNLS